MSDALVPYGELERMADVVVRAGLFPGIKTQQQALTLFLVAQAEGLHPMTAALRYNVIQGRPAMKAEAMLASFMERGGTVAWTEYTDDAVTGIFTSKGVPTGVTVRWTMADAKRAGVTMNQTWTKYPRQMLKARVASDGVRMADPSVNSGRYTPEEVQEFRDEPKTVAADAEIVTDYPTETDLTAAIADAQEIKRPVKCPECQSDCGIYASSQTGNNFERKYRQCNVAHENIEYLIAKEGFTAQKASALNAKHYRQWIEPPTRKVPAAKEGGGAAQGVPPSQEPAPSIFDQMSQIEKDVAAKIAAEKR